MPFVATKDNAGKKDIRISKIGRVRKNDTRPKSEIYEDEQLRIARKLKSYVTDAIQTAAKILHLEDAKPMEKLAASKFILNEYVKAIDAVYKDASGDEAGEEIQTPAAPVFSLTVINPEGE